MASTATAARTFLAFHHDAKLYKLPTLVTAVHAFSALEEANRLLFKKKNDDGDADDHAHHVVVTEKTIFHPQGGGQPSDVGSMTGPSGAVFDVLAVRMDAVRDGQVLHFGRFTGTGASPTTTTTTPPSPFQPGEEVTQSIDQEKRLLYSRLHTAGHVLGAAVRHLCEASIPGFDELKASHFPGSAACEFAGLLEGKWKPAIQEKVDAYIAAALPVEIEWWDEDEFRRRGLERLIPGGDGLGLAPGDKFRVVNIVGAEVYPCGGTHVDTTDQCGETKVTKISRSKGQSRVSYTVV
ncbi:putative alanyl-tRNA synthetase [Cryphonectria parasitica EP155]|uniref:Alanyl-tRNA synthetase n=1 Tax=Cryphonectria parasitica (strain ATCC 38755 / EP155) TaxID=660469 RepID=A0A9P5CLM2_CRYP1|nr:putative alanyl-tRNA synthetase [Cryphonectria parasitica EP155]KAF3763218.1 putative alanyl-tRNA synthetase [Cryphonectria parasitica EP155]